MNAAALASLFLVGLLGAVHCLGMCGGIVTALTVRMPRERPAWRLHAGYHAGRMSTYALLGALAGGAGSALLLLDALVPVQIAMFVAAQLMLIALGAYLMGFTAFLAGFERAGAVLWKRIQPFCARLLPVRTAPRAYAVGLGWGLLPCGLVYAVLATAFVTGSAASGALVMLAFGAGTLPTLAALATVLPQLQRLRRARQVRVLAGLAVAAFGVFGLTHAGHLHEFASSPWYCVERAR